MKEKLKNASIIRSIIVNSEELKYTKYPVIAIWFDGTDWHGQSNMLIDGEDHKVVELDVINKTRKVVTIKSGFEFIKNALSEKKYRCGCVLDFASKTIFFDSKMALDELKDYLSIRNWANYFISETKVNFSDSKPGGRIV